VATAHGDRSLAVSLRFGGWIVNIVQVSEEFLRHLVEMVGNPSERAVLHKMLDDLVNEAVAKIEGKS
jgi:hypothetical protein